MSKEFPLFSDRDNIRSITSPVDIPKANISAGDIIVQADLDQNQEVIPYYWLYPKKASRGIQQFTKEELGCAGCANARICGKNKVIERNVKAQICTFEADKPLGKCGCVSANVSELAKFCFKIPREPTVPEAESSYCVLTSAINANELAQRCFANKSLDFRKRA